MTRLEVKAADEGGGMAAQVATPCKPGIETKAGLRLCKSCEESLPEHGAMRRHTTTSTMALIIMSAPAMRQRRTAGARCCSAFLNQWPTIHTSTTLSRPREA